MELTVIINPRCPSVRISQVYLVVVYLMLTIAIQCLCHTDSLVTTSALLYNFLTELKAVQNSVHMEQKDMCICVEDGKGNKACSPRGYGKYRYTVHSSSIVGTVWEWSYIESSTILYS